MKFNQAIFALLALAGAALGAPAVADSSSVDMGQIKWTGDNTVRTSILPSIPALPPYVPT